MHNPTAIISHWLPEGELARWRREFAAIEFAAPDALPDAEIAYGLPDLSTLPAAKKLRWIQLASAGVPAPLCPIARDLGIRVTNLAGLYGPTIAEHAIAMLLTLSRNLHIVQRNQANSTWDRTVANTMRDLHSKTLAVVGVGNIGSNIARLAKALGMRVIGCKRTAAPSSFVDRLYAPTEVRAMFAEADHVAVAAPLTPRTAGMVGGAELAALKPGAIVVNVSRGPIVQETALVDALRSGHLGGAGLDVFAVEPLAKEHPLWTLVNVIVSPHYSGETVNNSALPAQRFTRNLHNYLEGKPLEGLVDLSEGY